MKVSIYRKNGKELEHLSTNYNVVVLDGLKLIGDALAGTVTSPTLNYAELAYYADGVPLENVSVTAVAGTVQATSTNITVTVSDPVATDTLKGQMDLIVTINFDLTAIGAIDFNEVALYHQEGATNKLFAYSTYDSVQHLSAATYVFEWTFTFYT